MDILEGCGVWLCFFLKQFNIGVGNTVKKKVAKVIIYYWYFSIPILIVYTIISNTFKITCKKLLLPSPILLSEILQNPKLQLVNTVPLSPN